MKKDYTFYNKYHYLKSKVAPFRKKRDFETVKLIASIDALMDRADVIYNGNIPGGYVLGTPIGINVENMMSIAEKYIDCLQKGISPLAGKFTEPGISLSDHSFIVVGDKIHLFYNRGFIGYDWPERAIETIGHAVTEDLINWEILPISITTDAESFEKHSVWSPGVIKKPNGKYYMFYTGVNENMAQAICLATSEDLNEWEKYSKEPIYVPGEWGIWDVNKWSDCRDSYVFQDDDGTYYMFFCTMVKEKNGEEHNAMGIASSKDLITWKDEKQISLKGCFHAPESPFVIKHNGKYYLFYTNCGKGTCYAVADSVVGDYEVKELLIGGEKLSEDLAHVPSCAEVFEFKGKWYISFATRLPGNEQYLEILEFFWDKGGKIAVGKQIK